mgnify:FL=1
MLKAFTLERGIVPSVGGTRGRRPFPAKNALDFVENFVQQDRPPTALSEKR